MKTVKEVSRLTGISVRTLHYYDAIGLFTPTAVTEAGYRLYDDEALARLHSILLFRELQFSLHDIKRILDSRDFDPDEALTQQIELLQLRYDDLGKLISYAREIQKKGIKNMDFTAFDKKEIDAYKEEVRNRWGNTEAYHQSQSRKVPDDANHKLMSFLKDIGKLQNQSPQSTEVQAAVERLQTHITDNYYTCTKEIFSGLGKMYMEDERFRRNINDTCGEGTAEFAAAAIAAFCK